MIQVLHRAFDILELLAKDREKSFTLSEIANQLELNHATCANILKTMVQRQYIEQLGPKKGYHLGPMTYSLTGNYTYRRDLVRAAEPFMQELNRRVGETVILGVLKDDKRVLLGQVDSEHDIQARTSQEKNAYDTAIGRLLIASLSQTERDGFITKYGLPPATIWVEASTADGFEEQVQLIQTSGYASQISSAQIIGFAVPIRRKGVVVAGLGVFLPVFRISQEKQSIILREMSAAAEQISKQLQ